LINPNLAYESDKDEGEDEAATEFGGQGMDIVEEESADGSGSQGQGLGALPDANWSEIFREFAAYCASKSDSSDSSVYYTASDGE
jgi:hypothetical protein